jgi:3-hydroxybutyryl-CoA dehydrogenase
MGAGIAQLLATKGMDVVLCDRNHEVLERGITTIRKSLSRFVRKGTLAEEDSASALSRITTCTSLDVGARSWQSRAALRVPRRICACHPDLLRSDS